MLAGPPETPVAVPSVVIDIAGGRPVTSVWVNGLGGITFRITSPETDDYVKWSPRRHGVDLTDEMARLRWAATYTTVPDVVNHGATDDAQWFVTRSLGAENLVSPRWVTDPARACAALGEGLRAFHDALPVASCPFDWRAATRVAAVNERAKLGGYSQFAFDENLADLTVDEALAIVRRIPSEDLVVCHGDACAPNTLIDDNGAWTAHVDLGSLGVGDRWADLAVASWSTEWNYGPGWDETVYASYGVEADHEKIRYYRVLWALG